MSRIDELSCSFCGKRQRRVRKLIAGPHAYICDGCVELASSVVGSGSVADTQLGQIRAVPEQEGQTTCSFCGKHRDQLTGLAAMTRDELAGPATNGPATICVECLSLCNEIVEEELE